MFRLPLLCCMLMMATFVQAQSGLLGYGFRAGLSLAKIDGPSELRPDGNELEQNKMSTGFHIGLTLNLKLTDIMGLRTELLYSQRGTDYTYDGPSYFLLKNQNLDPLILRGTRLQTINVSNAYLDIPIVAYYKIGYFEVSAGLNTGILVASTAGGNITYSGVSSATGAAITPFEVNLNYNYSGDEAGEASANTQNVFVDGFMYEVPEFIGAYYSYPAKDGRFFKTIDLGLNFGLSYYLNDGLFLGAKYILGLNDVTNNYYDVSLKDINPNRTLIPRSDVDKSSSFQFSVGFNF